MEKAIELLEKMIREGFLLHGSSRQICDAVEPRQARCSSGRQQGCLTGVYADDRLRAPCLRATLALLDARQGWSSSYSAETDDDPMVVTGQNATFRPGYIYVLPGTAFEDLGGEFFSKVEVMPHTIVRITPNILRLLPNMDIRIPVPTSW